MPGVPESDTYLDKNPRKINKYLIFVKWASCANELHEILKERGILSVILRGQNKTIIKTITGNIIIDIYLSESLVVFLISS